MNPIPERAIWVAATTLVVEGWPPWDAWARCRLGVPPAPVRSTAGRLTARSPLSAAAARLGCTEPQRPGPCPRAPSPPSARPLPVASGGASSPSPGPALLGRVAVVVLPRTVADHMQHPDCGRSVDRPHGCGGRRTAPTEVLTLPARAPLLREDRQRRPAHRRRGGNSSPAPECSAGESDPRQRRLAELPTPRPESVTGVGHLRAAASRPVLTLSDATGRAMDAADMTRCRDSLTRLA